MAANVVFGVGVNNSLSVYWNEELFAEVGIVNEEVVRLSQQISHCQI